MALVNDEPKYEGKFCFMEQIGEKASSYYNGEYLILRQTPYNIYGIKTAGGYDSHDMKVFSLYGGQEKWVVADFKTNVKAMRGLKERLETFYRESKVKKNWVESVYEDCRRHAERIGELLDEPCNLTVIEPPPVPEPIFDFSRFGCNAKHVQDLVEVFEKRYAKKEKQNG